ncbi:MAG: leucine-rich repeat domain-containing protein, partial [Clostridia bacterium]|nr:leucine-rich repeat domain-containing protein [Clostridia bacterium]
YTTPVKYYLPSYNPVVPTIYDDGVNGEAKVVAIGEYAFGCYTDYGADILTVQLPSTITSIGLSAFANCKKLTSINLPDGLTSVPDYALAGADCILTLPETVESLGPYAIAGCTLANTTTPRAMTTICFDGVNFVNDKLIISDSVTTIGSYAFQNSNITEIEIPNSVTTLEHHCFSGSNITDLVIPSTVTTIKFMAFNGARCRSITLLCNEASFEQNYGGELFASNPNLISMDLSQCVNYTVGWYDFGRCTSLTSVKFPTHITSLGTQTFMGCTSLKTFDLSPYTNVTEIGTGLFQNCTSLTSVLIPSNITNICPMAFADCSALTRLTFETSGTWYYTSDYNYTGGTALEITAGVDYRSNFVTSDEIYWYKAS